MVTMNSSAGIVVLILASCFLQVARGGPSWGYFGDDDESTWSANFPNCGGTSQSPINIVPSTAILLTLPFFNLNDFDTTQNFELKNNGHSVILTPKDVMPTVTGGGLSEEYTVAQAHLHWGKTSAEGSEHQLNGQKFPMELHIVTYKSSHGGINANTLADSDGLAVLGFFFEIGNTPHPGIQNIVDDLLAVKSPGSEITMSSAFKLSDIFPSSTTDLLSFYRYAGSLTTPNCNEAVKWTLFSSKISITEEQMQAFRTLQMNELNDDGNKDMYNNYRSVQPLNGRTVYKHLIL